MLNSTEESKPSRAQKLELLKLLTDQKTRAKRNQLARYQPYPKQMAFHAAGAIDRERLLMAANQVGKTYCGGAEMAIHLTGRYPEWWAGRRWSEPIRAWAGSVTGEVARDTVQRMMLGDPRNRAAWGEGMIPGDCLGRITLRSGIADAVDGLLIKHESGNFSSLGFKTYEAGRAKWQGETLDLIWLDEEAPIEVYSEALTRISATGGMIYTTFTPLLGVSEVVHMFLDSERRASDSATPEDG